MHKGMDCDMMMKHINPDLVTQIIQDIETKFGKISLNKVKSTSFLGCKLTKIDNIVPVQKKNYLQESIDQSGLSITHEVRTTPR